MSATAAVSLAAGIGHGAPKPHKVTGIICVAGCAGPREAAVGSAVRLTGRRLAATVEVMFPGELPATPTAVDKHAVEVIVPIGAIDGRPRALDAAGAASTAPQLEIVPPESLPAPGSFALERGSARPRKAFFDSRREARLRYRFRGYGPLDLRLTLVRRGKVVHRWTEQDRAPFARHAVRWNGLTESGGGAPKGRYRFRVASPGGPGRSAGRFRFYDHLFPVRGPHGYGDRFGVPRSGGRTHEGQDLWAGCGTRLEAARGGNVQARGYSASLYGHYLVIDGRQTDRDYMYSHLVRPPTAKRGARVRTGERIGAVGRSGNARGEACQLHFELWPSGWRNGSPRDPVRELRRWDGWS